MAHARTDRWGCPVHAARQEAVDLLDEATEQLVSLSGEPTMLAEQAASCDPELVLARVLQAYLALYAGSVAELERATALVGTLVPSSIGTGERERLHLLAAQSWAGGEWEGATGFLEQALLQDPRDLLALKVAQDLHFLLGNQNGLRDVVERVVAAWPSDRPGYGYVCGMHAFGLEENGDYDGAEEQARRALRANPGDVWAVHAQAHVFEMRGAQRPGIAFLERTAVDWSSSYFATHNWWHRALYHLDLGELDEALALFDGPIRGTRSDAWLDVDDAASLLWRLHLYGVDVDDRARTLLGDMGELSDASVSVFNDWHALMVAGLAERADLTDRLILANRRACQGSNRRAVEAAGLQLLEAFAAFAGDEARGALDGLVEIRSLAGVVGGSHAQRDVIDLTLMAAAARVGDLPLAQALLAERVQRKPSSEAAGLAVIRTNSD